MSGAVIWLTGLPASGKSTAARSLAAHLKDRGGRAVVVLDGDDVRGALYPSPGHGEEAREGFYKTLAQLAALIANQGVLVLVPATAHRRAHREFARAAAPDYVEIFVRTPLEVCESRDPKKLYASARRGEIDALPGVGTVYEEPADPDIVLIGQWSDETLSHLYDRLGVSGRSD